MFRAVPSSDFNASWDSFLRALRRGKGLVNQQVGRDGALSFPQYQLLETLRDTPARTVGELAESAGVAPPTATRMLDCLVRDGRVERRPAEHDRRSVLVSLTAEGRTALDVTYREVEAARSRVAEQLTPAEREAAAVLLRRLAEIVEDVAGGPNSRKETA
jgi:DNA-binding MarR family transcriptional regulator